jgi:hypothetical protein
MARAWAAICDPGHSMNARDRRLAALAGVHAPVGAGPPWGVEVAALATGQAQGAAPLPLKARVLPGAPL